MQLKVIKDYREKIFSQIEEGEIPKQNICDLFDALITDLEVFCEYVNFASPLGENVVDMVTWKKKHPREIHD